MRLIGWIFAGVSVATAATIGIVSYSRGNEVKKSVNNGAQKKRNSLSPSAKSKELRDSWSKYSKCRDLRTRENCLHHLPEWFRDTNSVY